jgi:hypothetical protein
MAGKSKLTADAAEHAVLRALSKSEQRGEADRARAILLTLEGRRAEEIAATLGVHPWTAPGAQGKNTAFFANHGRVQPSIRPGIAAHMAAGPDDNSPLRSLSHQRTLCPMHPAGWTELGKT